MYEKPALNRVGDAREVILGAAFVGNDVDSTWVPGSPNGDEWADDTEL